MLNFINLILTVLSCTEQRSGTDAVVEIPCAAQGHRSLQRDARANAEERAPRPYRIGAGGVDSGRVGGVAQVCDAQPELDLALAEADAKVAPDHEVGHPMLFP